MGFGAALVLAQPSGKPSNGIPICHSGNGKNFTAESPDASGVLSGHDHHDFDIIPPFSITNQDGTTTDYPGKNLDSSYGAGYTGAEVLANGCEVPTGEITEPTHTVTTQIPETLPATVTVAPETVTEPATTVTTTVVETVTVPSQTVTVPGAVTTVTVPSGETTTVTVPANTVTLPSSTITAPGETLTQPGETVTVPGTTTTLTAAGTTTVVTVTAPGIQFVHGGGVLAAKIQLALKQHRRLVRIRRRVLHVLLNHRSQQRLIVIVVRRGCPPGSNLFHGRCAPIVRGRG